MNVSDRSDISHGWGMHAPMLDDRVFKSTDASKGDDVEVSPQPIVNYHQLHFVPFRVMPRRTSDTGIGS